ncbi:MAG: fibronectin type III domain-containing protein [Verrucomicrobiota bacterium]
MRFFVEGSASGKLQIPAYDEFPEQIKSAFPPLILAKPFLPKTLAAAGIAYRNNTFSSSLNLPIVGDVVVAARYTQNQVQILVGQNLTSLKKVIGFGAPGGAIGPGHPPDPRAMLQSLGSDQLGMGGSPVEGDGLDVPAGKLATAPMVGAVTVPAGAARVIFRLYSPSGPTRFSLIQPDGNRLLPEGPGAATYQEIPETKESYFVVPSPAAGSWGVEAVGGSSGPFVLDGWGANSPPSLGSLAATQTGDNVAIIYDALDSDDEVSVALYADTDSTGFDGTLIADHLPENAAGRFAWNTAAAHLPSGEYSIYAVVDDGRNVPVQGYASGKVIIVDPLAPPAPQNIKAEAKENSLLVSWDSVAHPNLRGYLLQYAPVAGPPTDQTEVVDVGPTNVFRLTRLRDNSEYRLAIVAYSQIEGQGTPAEPPVTIHKSLRSGAATATTGAASLPLARVTSPTGGEQLLQNSSLDVSWKLENASDVLDQAVDLSTDGGNTWRPLARHLPPSSRHFNWDIPTSLHTSHARVRVSALDAAGNEGIALSPATFTISGLDGDGDGMPDDWEMSHGLNASRSDDALLDSDADGLSNIREYLAGTDPQNPGSSFSAAVIRAGNGVAIRFETVAGRRYELQITGELGAETWTAADALVGSGTVQQFSDAPLPGTGARFYRILVSE